MRRTNEKGRALCLIGLAWLLFVSVGCRRDDVDDAASAAAVTPVDVAQPAEARSEPQLDRIEVHSDRLSAFTGGTVSLHAIVLTPHGYDPAIKHPTMYVVHGFGGRAERNAQRALRYTLSRGVGDRSEPGLVFVFVDANHAWGHHVFADSAGMGPWGTALATELVPAVDRRYGTEPKGDGRFVTGHSSGGWSSLWLQISHPDLFGGVWSTAPDPVDFRDFVGVDIYTFGNAYRTPIGQTVHLKFRGGEPVESLQEFVDHEVKTQPIGGQFFSFDAVFSPLGADGLPKPLFDRTTGQIDREVATAWRSYDISWMLRTQWAQRAAGLSGKLHVIVGEQDTYGLERPVRLLAEALHGVGSDASFVFVPERDHSDLFRPHPVHYPDGLWRRIEQEALAAYAARQR